jgi:hypothetical protein
VSGGGCGDPRCGLRVRVIVSQSVVRSVSGAVERSGAAATVASEVSRRSELEGYACSGRAASVLEFGRRCPGHFRCSSAVQDVWTSGWSGSHPWAGVRGCGALSGGRARGRCRVRGAIDPEWRTRAVVPDRRSVAGVRAARRVAGVARNGVSRFGTWAVWGYCGRVGGVAVVGVRRVRPGPGTRV